MTGRDRVEVGVDICDGMVGVVNTARDIVQGDESVNKKVMISESSNAGECTAGQHKVAPQMIKYCSSDGNVVLYSALRLQYTNKGLPKYSLGDWD